MFEYGYVVQISLRVEVHSNKFIGTLCCTHVKPAVERKTPQPFTQRWEYRRQKLEYDQLLLGPRIHTDACTRCNKMQGDNY